MIDVVGHFGSRFSFATVAAEIARGLKAQGFLGRIINFDDCLFEAHADLEEHLSVNYSQFALFVVLPVEHMTQLTCMYKKVALYISPNSDTLGQQYVKHLQSFDHIFVPSMWCYDTLLKAGVSKECLEVLPLGCENVYFDLRESTVARLTERLSGAPKVFHLMTDGFLPGRKGTTDVIKAWNELKGRGIKTEATLTIHAPMGVADEVYYYACQSKLFEPEVTIQTGAHRGVTSTELAYMMADHDLVILPSRCEGFGMMILAALALGIPTITTNWTGQMDFLSEIAGWDGPSGHPHIAKSEGRWGTTDNMGTLEGETGLAPVIDYKVIADHLQLMLNPEMRNKMLNEPNILRSWSWESLRSKWSSSLIKWSEGI